MIEVNNESGAEVDELALVQLAEFALARLRIIRRPSCRSC